MKYDVFLGFGYTNFSEKLIVLQKDYIWQIYFRLENFDVKSLKILLEWKHI